MLHIHRFAFYTLEINDTNTNLHNTLHTLFLASFLLFALHFIIVFVYGQNKLLQSRMQRKTNTKSRFDEKLDFEAFCAFSRSLYQFVAFTRFSAHRNPYKPLQNNELRSFFGKQSDYILAQKTRFSARIQPILAMKNEIILSIWRYFTPFSGQITLFPSLNYIFQLFALLFLL